MRQIEKMSVYKEVHSRKNGRTRKPLHESIQGKRAKEGEEKFKCRIILTSGRELDMSADSLSQLRENVDNAVAELHQGKIEGVSYSPPDNVRPKEYLSVRMGVPLLRSDGSMVNKRYESSGTMMVAEPLPLSPKEIGQFNGE